jgi:selenide,water dikinase
VIAAGPPHADRPLTARARGAGCGCKLSPGFLAEALAAMPGLPADPALLVGHAGLDDAAVVRVRDDLALVSSVDFFTPMVDDPDVFGAIAATNALSDLYAMGASPLLALAVACYPRDADPAVLGRVMAAGARVGLEHGCPVLGGHSVDDPEPKYGLCVIGTAHPERLLANAAGRAGDVLVLTKPLGVGVAVTAARSGRPEALDAAVASMLRSNRGAGEAALACGIRGATDVTGFGLLGHLREMAAASGVAAEVDAGAPELLPGALELAADGHLSGGGGRNADFLADWVDWDPGVDEARRALLVDPQTSGGLLLAVPPAGLGRLAAALGDAGAGAAEVGRLVAGPAGRIRVHG